MLLVQHLVQYKIVLFHPHIFSYYKITLGLALDSGAFLE